MVHAVGGSPYIGNTIGLDLAGAQPVRAALSVIGVSNTSWPPFVLPLDLRIIGAPSCFIYTNVIISSGAVTGILGGTSVPWPVPDDPTLIGQTLYTQYYVQDTVQNPVNLVTSNAVAMIVGG